MPEESMREQLEAAFDGTDDEQEETGGSDEGSQEPLGASAEEGEPQALGGGTPAAEEPKEEVQPDGEEAQRADDIGEQIPAAADAGGAEEPAGGDIPAPVSWKPGVREHWAKLPPEVQQEVQRREREIQQGLQQASSHRKVAEEYFKTVAPFQSFIQASNSSPSQAITQLMTTAAQLTMGTPAKKAEVVRNIISEYGVDIKMLDDALAGDKLPDDPNAPLLSAIDQRLAPINEFMGQVGARQDESREALDYEAADTLDTFASQNEFYEDLRDDMADLMEMAANRGRNMTVEDAYKRAAQSHPEIGPIYAQRIAAAENKLTSEAVNKKRNAASSIHGSPGAGKAAGGEGDMRSVMETAWDDSQGEVGHG